MTTNNLTIAKGEWKGIPWIITRQHTLIFNPKGTTVQYQPYKEDSSDLDQAKIWASHNGNPFPWHPLSDQIQHVIFNENIDFSSCSSFENLFADHRNLKTVDMHHLKTSFPTSRLKSCRRMFSGCSHLTSIDMSPVSLAQHSTVNLNNMLTGCSSLLSFQSPKGNIHHLHCYETFMSCRLLESIDLSALQMDNPHPTLSAIGICSYCTHLKNIRFPQSVYPIQIRSLDRCFEHCEHLSHIDLSGLSLISRLADQSFAHCTSLTSITPFHDIAAPTVCLLNTFINCSSLAVLDLPYLFPGEAALHIKGEDSFFNCHQLHTLILSSHTKIDIRCIQPLIPHLNQFESFYIPPTCPAQDVLSIPFTPASLIQYLEEKYPQKTRLPLFTRLQSLPEWENLIPDLLKRTFLTQQQTKTLIHKINKGQIHYSPETKSAIMEYIFNHQ